jgi:hypothetical protein
MNPDPDPGGPKTCGSGGSGFGYATLIRWMGGIAWRRPGRRIWSDGPRYPDPDAHPSPTAGTGLKKGEESKQTAVKSLSYNWRHTQAGSIQTGERNMAPSPPDR